MRGPSPAGPGWDGTSFPREPSPTGSPGAPPAQARGQLSRPSPCRKGSRLHHVSGCRPVALSTFPSPCSRHRRHLQNLLRHCKPEPAPRRSLPVRPCPQPSCPRVPAGHLVAGSCAAFALLRLVCPAQRNVKAPECRHACQGPLVRAEWSPWSVEATLVHAPPGGGAGVASCSRGCEGGGTGVCVRPSLLPSRYADADGGVTPSFRAVLEKASQQQQQHLTLPPGTQEGSSSFTPSLTRVCYRCHSRPDGREVPSPCGFHLHERKTEALDTQGPDCSEIPVQASGRQ